MCGTRSDALVDPGCPPSPHPQAAGSCCAPEGLACCSRQEEPGSRANHTDVHHLLGRLPEGHVVFLLRDKSRGQWGTRIQPSRQTWVGGGSVVT